MDHPVKPVTDIVETMDEMAARGTVCVDDLLAEFGTSAHAPALFIPAAMLVSPLSGVPFASSLLGLTMMLIAMQAAIARERVWLPHVIRRREIPADKAQRVSETMRSMARRIEGWTRRRLSPLVSPLGRRLAYGVCAVIGGIVPMLELVPFSSSFIGGGIALIALGMMARDGLFVLGGLCLQITALSLAFGLIATVA